MDLHNYNNITPKITSNIFSNKNKTNTTNRNGVGSEVEVKTKLEELEKSLNTLEINKKTLLQKLNELKELYVKTKEDCVSKKKEAIRQEQEFLEEKKKCQDRISKQIKELEKKLASVTKNNNGICDDNSPYQQILNKIESLKEEYEKCEKENISTNITQYTHVFITQIYETNEYEGNVTVTGDDEWDENNQLIKDCLEYDESQFAQPCIKAANKMEFSSIEERIVFLKECTKKYYDNRA